MQVTILVVLTVLSIMASQYFDALWNRRSSSPLHYISTVVFVISIVAVVVANIAWRWIWRRFPVLNRILFPDLNGEWQGVLKSTWQTPNDAPLAPIPTTIWIRQNLFTIHVQQRTSESDSWSTHVIAEAHADAGRFKLCYMYTNRPNAEVVRRSSQHDGVAVLEIIPDIDANGMRGHYYTSRHTSGDIALSREG